MAPLSLIAHTHRYGKFGDDTINTAYRFYCDGKVYHDVSEEFTQKNRSLSDITDVAIRFRLLRGWSDTAG